MRKLGSPAMSGSLEPDGPLRRHLAHDRLDGRRTSDTVPAQQAYDFAGIDAQIDALEDMTLAIVGVQVLDLEHQAASSPR